jgi:hypothetical protein
MMLKNGSGKWISSKARITTIFIQNGLISIEFQTLLHIYLIFKKFPSLPSKALLLEIHVLNFIKIISNFFVIDKQV